jgi:hypothetical protein
LRAESAFGEERIRSGERRTGVLVARYPQAAGGSERRGPRLPGGRQVGRRPLIRALCFGKVGCGGGSASGGTETLGCLSSGTTLLPAFACRVHERCGVYALTPLRVHSDIPLRR